MARLNSIKIDPTLSLDGVWFNWVAGIKLLIARVGNDKFAARVRFLKKKYGNKKNIEDITREAAATTLLIGWEGIEEDDDTPIEYSHETSLAWFNDPEMDELVLFTLGKANDADNYRRAELEDASGN